MKQFTYKWLRRFSGLLAIKLFILAVSLTLLRILFVSIEDYKGDLASWIASEYKINLSAEDISAGIDFSGIILTLNNIKLQESSALPFAVTIDYLFLHLDFWDSFRKQKLDFNRISLQGVDVNLKRNQRGRKTAEQTLPTLNSIQDVFLQQMNAFSVKECRIHFQDHFNHNKTITIEKLSWLNNGDFHQGVGRASLPHGLGDNSLAFIVNLSGEQENKKDPLHGTLYVDADNLNIRDYLIAHVNPQARISHAVLGFQLWADFSLTKLQQVQLLLKPSQFAWSLQKKQHNWLLNSGSLQLTNSKSGWLLDSYNIDVEHNQKKLQGIELTAHGHPTAASFDFTALYLKDLLPFYLLNSDLPDKQILALQSLQMDAQIHHAEIHKSTAGKWQFSTQLNAFKNRPYAAIPGLSHADIAVQGNAFQGGLTIKLAPQKIYFDGQFSRPMPIESADLALHWSDTPAGFKLFSEQSLLKTADLDTNTQFSLLFPNKKADNQSPFLSLYSYASLSDASQAQYYYPIKAMGEDVFDYLQPTLKKGSVKGAKILWYGAFNQYPYSQHQGVFQAWVPLRDAQYDFYGEWLGLTDLDLNLLFENDYLTMDALHASLDKIKVDKLSAKIDHLNPDGILTINADIAEDAQKISHYLKHSPLKESVGRALNVIQVDKPLSGNLQLTIPFNRSKKQTQTRGEVNLFGNNINIEVADNTVVPLKDVEGKFSFVNGNLTAKNLKAQLWAQKVQFSFNSSEKKNTYQVNADIGSRWDLQQLSQAVPQLEPVQLSGALDWTGNIDFEYDFSGGYKSRIVLNSATQGVTSRLPVPFNKNALQSWPTKVVISGDNKSTTLTFNIKDKLDFIGKLDYQGDARRVPFFSLNIGADKLANVDTQNHVVKIVLDKLNISDWYQQWRQLNKKEKVFSENKISSMVALDQIAIEIKHAMFFEQPLSALKMYMYKDLQKWSANIHSDNLQASMEQRAGIPARFDIDIKKLNFQALDLSSLNMQKKSDNKGAVHKSVNLRKDYPEVFAKCTICLYGNYDLSPLQLHLYPSKSRLNIDYLKIGTEEEFTHLSGIWDQRRTNIIIDSLGNKNNSFVKRLGFTSPVTYQKAEVSGALNWIGAPWQFNFPSLNGAFSAELKDGSITEVSDKGARLLSLFSLDGIRRSLNLEFNNVFAKGFNFDDFTFSANITDGIMKNDDFYLNGSAGKIVGNGLIDLPNYDSNYRFSYSPAVTSSLPVLTAFAINPLTGAAVLLMSKILEPVVETIIRVDFSVKGPLNNPVVKLINRQKGKVKLQNSEVLEKINNQPLNMGGER